MGGNFKYKKGTGRPTWVGRHWTEYKGLPADSPVAKPVSKSPTEGQKENGDDREDDDVERD